MKALEGLATGWLEEAETLDRFRDTRGAEVTRMLAGELRAAIVLHEAEVLNLSEAADASGYSRDHLRHLIKNGTLPNAGKRGNPGVRRSDLPVKPGGGKERQGGGFDASEEARKVVGRIGR